MAYKIYGQDIQYSWKYLAVRFSDDEIERFIDGLDEYRAVMVIAHNNMLDSDEVYFVRELEPRCLEHKNKTKTKSSRKR